MVETLSQNEIEALLSALSPVSAKDGGASGNKTSSQSSGNFGPGQSGQMGSALRMTIRTKRNQSKGMEKN